MLVTARSLLDQPAPTPEERAAFVEHLASAHSWYKHLSLARRSPFVVFLAAPISDDYRARFGHLAYAWKVLDAPEPDRWVSDRDETIDVDARVVANAGFTLGPYVSTDDNAIEVIVNEWREHALLDEAARERVGALEVAYRAWDEAYRALTDDERLRAIDSPAPHEPAALRRVRDAERAMRAVYGRLQHDEAMHVERAIDRLLALRDEVAARPFQA